MTGAEVLLEWLTKTTDLRIRSVKTLHEGGEIGLGATVEIFGEGPRRNPRELPDVSVCIWDEALEIREYSDEEMRGWLANVEAWATARLTDSDAPSPERAN